jgi:hypothetical protein
MQTTQNISDHLAELAVVGQEITAQSKELKRFLKIFAPETKQYKRIIMRCRKIKWTRKRIHKSLETFVNYRQEFIATLRLQPEFQPDRDSQMCAATALVKEYAALSLANEQLLGEMELRHRFGDAWVDE